MREVTVREMQSLLVQLSEYSESMTCPDWARTIVKAIVDSRGNIKEFNTKW